MASFEIYRDSAGQYRWRFRASNGRIIADSSEGYFNKSDCLHGIALVQRDAPSAQASDATRAASGFGY